MMSELLIRKWIYHGRKETGISKYLTCIFLSMKKSHTIQASKETSQLYKVEADILNYAECYYDALADFEPP